MVFPIDLLTTFAQTPLLTIPIAHIKTYEHEPYHCNLTITPVDRSVRNRIGTGGHIMHGSDMVGDIACLDKGSTPRSGQPMLGREVHLSYE